MNDNGRPLRVLLLTTARTYRAPDFLRAAEKLGIEVVQVIDTPEALAGEWEAALGVDFTQPQQATQTIVDYAQKRPIGAILSVDDSGSLLAARASSALGLPHNAPAAAEAARDKLRMRQLLSAAGVASPRFWAFTTADDPAAIARRVDFPCVVKPTRLNGSRGVIRADTPDDLQAAVARTARLIHRSHGDDRPRPLLVERYIPGVEVALEGMLDDGRLRVLALFDKPDPLEGPFFEETIYVTPSRLPAAVQESIAATTAQAAAALGLRRGPVHAELRVNDAGAWIVEIAGRSIGGLCARTLQFGSDASLEELILRQACGLDLGDTHVAADARGVMMIPIPAEGLLRGVSGVAAAEAVELVTAVEITAKLNYPLVPLPEGDAYLGFIFARGATPAAVEQALRTAHAQLHFRIDPLLPMIN